MRVEPCAKRIRTYLGGELVADTTKALLVWEKPSYPTYYLPVDDVRSELLVEDAALRFGKAASEELRGHVRLDWNAMDAWFEEDEEVFVHPRDPYTRVDILSSSRHVRVEIDGVVLAESAHPHALFETRLPPRWYLPKSDVRMDLLEHTDSVTRCPYKGQAEYWSARVNGRVVENIAWSYRTPLPESQKVAGLIAFYNERVDLFIDGELQERPRTKFS